MQLCENSTRNRARPCPPSFLVPLLTLTLITLAIFGVNNDRFTPSNVSSKHLHTLCVLVGVQDALYLTSNLFPDLLDHLVGAIAGGIFS